MAAYLAMSAQTGQFSNFGPNAQAFETEVQARYAPAASVSTCTSCTAGLTAALLALGVSAPVVVPAFTFPATHDAVQAAGLRPVPADVDPVTGVLAPAATGAAIQAARAGAVMAVRPFGVWSDLGPLAATCREHGVPLIIDNASGFGVDAATLARYACPGSIEVFSFHATKPAAIGEGGLMLYPPSLHARIRATLNFGMAPGTTIKTARGINGEMDELRAAAARAMLHGLPARVGRRQEMAATLTRLALRSEIQPFIPQGSGHNLAWQCFPLLLPPGIDPAAIVSHCADAGLVVRRYYHPALGSSDNAPVSYALASRALCLPIYSSPEPGDPDDIWTILMTALGRASSNSLS